MSITTYVWEKLAAVYPSLEEILYKDCDDSMRASVLENATMSQLNRLTIDDINKMPSEQDANDLQFIMSWTKDNMIKGNLLTVPNKDKFIELVTRIARLRDRLAPVDE